MKRKTKIAILIFIAFAVIIGGVGVPLIIHRACTAHVVTGSNKKVIYHCPMHPNYLSDKPGKCPICNMTLVPINEPEPETKPGESSNSAQKRTILYYQDAMNRHTRRINRGKRLTAWILYPFMKVIRSLLPVLLR